MTEKVEQKSFGASLAAVAVDRLFVPRRDGGLMPRRRFLVFLLICLLLHFSLLAFLLWSDWQAAKNAPPLVEEIPVEVISEPPPPPPPPPPEPAKPEPEQQQKPPPPPPPPRIEEDPAFDAPKAASETDSKTEAEKPEEQKKAPREDKPTDKVAPKDDKPQGLKDAKDDSGDAKPAEAAVEKKTDDKPDAEIIERAQETPKQPDKPNAPEAQKAKKGEAMSIADQIAAMTPLPDFKLRAPPKKSPVGGGQAKTTYLTILYGLIMPHMRIPPSARGVGGTEKGVIAFYIDEAGNLTHQAVYRSSGLPELDAAALSAVRRAAPFPPPPAGLPHSMLFSYATK